MTFGSPVVFFDPHVVLEAEVQLRVDAQLPGILADWFTDA